MITNLYKTLRVYIFLSAITFIAVSMASTEVSDKNVPQDTVTEETDLANREAVISVEMSRLFNELRSEVLDDKSTELNRWLAFIAIVLTVFAIIIPVFGFLGYKKFERYEEDAKRYLDVIKGHEKKALASVDGMRGADNTSIERGDTSKEHSAKIREITDDTKKTLPEKATTGTKSFQQDGGIKNEIKYWQAIAKEKEINNPKVAADTWFLVGFLYQLEDPTTTNQLSNKNALEAYTNTIRLNPNHAASYFNRGNVNANLGDHENALKDYDCSIKIIIKRGHADNPRLTHMLCRLYFNSGNSYTRLGIFGYANAIDNYESSFNHAIIAYLIYRGYIRYNRGNAKFCVEDYSSAIEDYKEAILCGTNLRGSWFNQGNAEMKLGDYEKALKSYDESIKADANHKDAYSNRIVAKIALGRIGEALSDIAKLKNSEFGKAKDGVTQMAIGNIRIFLGNRARKELDGSIRSIELALVGNMGSIGMFGGVAPSGDARYLPGGNGFPGSPGFLLKINTHSEH